MTTPKRPRKRRATIRLPALDSHQALVLVDLLERTQRAIWRAHGDAMADRLAALGIETPPPIDAVFTDVPYRNRSRDDDLDF